jgi:hypothetical protein
VSVCGCVWEEIEESVCEYVCARECVWERVGREKRVCVSMYVYVCGVCVHECVCA